MKKTSSCLTLSNMSDLSKAQWSPKLPLLVLALIGSGLHTLSCAAENSAVSASQIQKEIRHRDPPLLIEGERIDGITDNRVSAQGDAMFLRPGEQAVFADQIDYDQLNERLKSHKNVRIEQDGGIITGNDLDIMMKTRRGYMTQPHYFFDEEGGRGTGKMLFFEGKDIYRLKEGTYTTCSLGNDEWFIKAKELKIDRIVQEATAHNASIEFKGKTLLYLPYFDVSLNRERRSGFLTPSLLTSGNSGVQILMPYYWNIAPNRDMTFFPRFLQKRGIQLGTELRYIEPSYKGTLNAEYLPNDQVRHLNRYSLSLSHEQTFSPFLRGYLNISKTSDNDYFRDLSTRIATTSQTYLPREAILVYTRNGWNLTGRFQRFQTLQDPVTPITPTYDRVPQITLNGTMYELFGGANLNISSEYVAFRRAGATSTDGQRFTFYPSLSLPIMTTYAHFTPKIGVHMTRYNLANIDVNPNDPNSIQYPTSISRTVPILSVDSGLTFERNLKINGSEMTQTLEPRLFYVYAPYRNQENIPLFDTALADFNFAQMFNENVFTGGDRIADANQLTLALTSRLINPRTGVEAFRVAVGQRFYFKDQEVMLNATTPQRQSRTSDIIAYLNGRLTNNWLLDATWQYNPNLHQTQKFNTSVRYSPEQAKIINLSYRYARDPSLLRQIDISSQWLFNQRWSTLARWNYSVPDRQVVEALAGLEYNGGCWALRLVAHRLATSSTQINTSLFVQLELNEVSRLGTNPFDTLRQNIPGYTKTNEMDVFGFSHQSGVFK